MIWFSERTGKLLTFEEWKDTNSDELNCLFAENGADREMDFDYAYVEKGELAKETDWDGYHVPKKFHKEFNTWKHLCFGEIATP